jgi:hypothetical protein
VFCISSLVICLNVFEVGLASKIATIFFKKNVSKLNSCTNLQLVVLVLLYIAVETSIFVNVDAVEVINIYCQLS